MRREEAVSSQQGMALVLVLLIMTCVVIVALGLVHLYTARARLNGSNVRQYTAEYVADTGLDKYIWGLNQGNINFFQQNIATYSAYYPEEENGVGGYYSITEQNSAPAGTTPSRATVTCTGWLSNDPTNQYTVKATLKERAFTDNAYFTNNEEDPSGTTVYFANGDTINGNLSTNGTINISGSPVFNGTVQYAGNPPQPTGNAAVYTVKGQPQKVSTLSMPASDAQLAQYAKNGGIYLMGRTCIFIEGNQLTYVNYDENKNDSTYQQFVSPPPISIDKNPSFNGVIYVDNASGDTGDLKQDLLNACTGSGYDDTEKFTLTRGNVFVSSYDSTGTPQGLGKGMPSSDGAYLTIGAANNIYITAVDPTTGAAPSGTLLSNITSSSSSNSYGIIYGRTTFNDTVANINNDANTTNGDDMLGLIANNYIMILRYGWPTQTSPYYANISNNYSPNNVNVDAAVMSTSYSFMVEEYWANINDNNINLQGSLIQQYRGPVGETNGYGYSKNYWYDSRMLYETPPDFLNPTSSGWGIMSWQRITVPTVQFTTPSMTIAGWNSSQYQSGVLINGTLPVVVKNVTPANALSNQSVTWSINSNGTNASIDPYGETWTNNGVALPSSTLTAGSTAGTAIVYATPTVQYQSTNPYASQWSTNIAIMSITISGNNSVTVGGSINLTAQVNPGTVLLNSMTWSVDKPALASVSGGTTHNSSGSYSGTLNAGTTTGTVNVTFQITLADGTTVLTSPAFPVTITPVYVTGIIVTGPTPISHGGNSYTYTATVTPANATNPAVTWSWTKVSGSSHLSLTLTPAGLDKATLTTDSHTGTITITATAADGSGVFGTTNNITIN